MPTDDELARYNASYFDNAHGGAAVADAARPFHRAINRVRVRHVEAERQRQRTEVRRVLEVGPGLGDFCAAWCATHPAAEYHVIEADDAQRARLAAQGVRAHATMDELPADMQFDLLVLSHVLEHTSDPRAVLSALVGRLRSGAMLFIEVPCRDHEHKREDEPHLLFFDRDPMGRLLARVGVRPIRLSYHGETLDVLKSNGGGRMIFRKIGDRVTRALDTIGVLPIPPSLAGVPDAAGRAAVRSVRGHVEQSRPSWWLRAIGVVNSGSNPA